jgi:hypothetical protein
MQIMHENSAKPFHKDDEETKARFDTIVKDLHDYCHKNPMDSIITCVFTCYREAHWMAEMIVRVIHLELHYSDEKLADYLKELKEIPCVKALFDFYEDTTHREIEAKVGTIKNELVVREVNRFDGLASEIKKFGIKIRADKLNKLEIEENGLNLVESNAPYWTLLNVFHILRRVHSYFVDSSNIFIQTESLKNEMILTKVQQAKKALTGSWLVINCSSSSELDEKLLKS